MTVNQAKGLCFCAGWITIAFGTVLINYAAKRHQWTGSERVLACIQADLIGIAFLISS